MLQSAVSRSESSAPRYSQMYSLFPQLRSLLSPTSIPSMPLFSNIYGVNINGGNFYDVGGDMHWHVENNQQLAIREHHMQLHTAGGGSQSTLEGLSTSQQVLGSSTADGGCSFSGVTRTSRHGGSGRPLPYSERKIKSTNHLYLITCKI
jgi:hypothetical protein